MYNGKKIVFFGGNFDNAGGTERVGAVIANELAAKGYDIVLLSLQGENSPYFFLDTKIERKTLYSTTGRSLYRTPGIISKLRKILIDEKADVLVVIESMLALFSIPALVGRSVKHICWEHFNFKSDLGKAGRRVARRLAARYCDAVVTLTDRDRRYWLEATRPKAAIFVIPNPAPFPVQSKNTLPRESRLVLSVGRLVKIKGYDRLLNAWKAVIDNQTGWRLRIVGSGAEESALKTLASTLNLGNTVEFVPATADVAKHYREADIFCLSSRFEGFPMVLVEAACFGIPVVSFDCDTGPAEILAETGSILVLDGDIDAFKNGLLKFIRSSAERERVGRVMGECAERFQPQLIVDKWIALLEEVNRH